jgi:hypothetical protein
MRRERKTLSVTDGCRDGAVITQYDVSGRDSLANIAHSQGFRGAANQGGNTFVKNAQVYPASNKSRFIPVFPRQALVDIAHIPKELTDD